MKRILTAAIVLGLAGVLSLASCALRSSAPEGAQENEAPSYYQAPSERPPVGVAAVPVPTDPKKVRKGGVLESVTTPDDESGEVGKTKDANLAAANHHATQPKAPVDGDELEMAFGDPKPDPKAAAAASKQMNFLIK